MKKITHHLMELITPNNGGSNLLLQIYLIQHEHFATHFLEMTLMMDQSFNIGTMWICLEIVL
jgi:hypothetical protein